MIIAAGIWVKAAGLLGTIEALAMLSWSVPWMGPEVPAAASWPGSGPIAQVAVTWGTE